MFVYFVHKKNGAISVMLAVLLIAVLSCSSSLMEIARYRSLERFFKEATENAGFSMLSHYDRDLYKNFGLLAVEQKANAELFLEYLKENLEGMGSTLEQNGVDHPLDAGDVDVEKLFNLAEREVFQAQIMEFTAYRAPASMLDNALNIEETVGELVKKLEEALPILKLFENLSKAGQKIMDAYLKLDEYCEQGKVLQNAKNAYVSQVESYNAAVAARDAYISEHENKEEDKDKEKGTKEDYESGLKTKNEAVAAQATALSGKIESLKKELGTYYKKYTEFFSAFDAMQEANIKAMLSGAETDAAGIEDETARENAKNMIKEMKAGYHDSENMFDKILNAMDEITEAYILASQDGLTEQLNELTGEPEDMQQTESVPVAKSYFLWDAVKLGISTLSQIVSVVQEWAKVIGMIGDVLEAMKIMFSLGTYHPEYNNEISVGLWSGLPGPSNGGRLKKAENPYAAKDSAAVTEQLAKTEEVAGAVGFDIDSLYPSGGISEMHELQNAMDRMTRAEAAFREKCQELENTVNYFNIIGTLVKIIEIIGTLVEYLASLVNLVTVFIKVASAGLLPTLLYQRVFSAVYANDMFSNRTSGGEGERLNGSSLPDYSTSMIQSQCFDMANTEYIVSGSRYETVNQTNVFNMILMLRILCNIPAILSNQSLMNTVTALCETIIGIIGAVILVAAFLFIEAWADMVFMIYGDTDKGVDIIKMKGYFSFDEGGNNKLKQQMQELLPSSDELWKPKTEGTGETEKKKDEDGNALTWTYKDHLFLLLLLCVSNDTIYARCADLIEMQMGMEKRLAGESDPFRLKKMATYLRIEAEAEYTPLLPVPTIPGLNDNGIGMKTTYYSGY